MIDPKLIEALKEPSDGWSGDAWAVGADIALRAATALDLASKREAELVAELRKLRAAIAIKGGNEFAPTQWAYDQACAALVKHRNRANAAEAEVARLTAALGEV